MFGWRGRIGLLVPSVNTVVEPEGCALLPEGFAVYATRMRNSRSDADDMAQMCAHVDRGVDELLSANVDVIAFACTAGSFFEGTDGEETLRERLRGGSRIEAVTTAGAVAGALRALDAQRVAMVTPYIPELNELEVKFLEGWGFDVVSQAGMGILTAFDIGVVPLAETYRFAREHVDAGADALFISCTNLRTMDVIQALEEDLGIPVVTSNQATYWQCLRALGHTAAIPGYGRVFELSPVAGPLPVTV
jgi:maleate isomerase